MTLDDALLSGEIADFVRGGDRWPSAQEWEDAGQRRLYVEMMRAGGSRRWVGGVHLPYRPTPDDVLRESARAQLTRFLRVAPIGPMRRRSPPLASSACTR